MRMIEPRTREQAEPDSDLASSTVTSPPAPPATGVIGPYQLRECLGHGGAGAVYRAVHGRSGREVALKVVRIAEEGPARDLEQVAHEAMAMAALRHPHVVTCYSFGEDGRHLYLALELLAGGDTARLVARNGCLDESTIRTFASQCAQGLAAIHGAGLVHRDIKPSNVLLDGKGHAKLADFGLACLRDTPHAASGDFGTPAYLPPEAVGGEQPADFRGDIYSLGATMFFWAAGASPFAGDNALATLHRILTSPPPDLAALRSDLSPELVEIIATAMARNREQRFPDAPALLAALRGELPALAAPVATIPVPIPIPASGAAPTRPWQRVRVVAPWAVAAVLAVSVVLSLSGANRVAIPAPVAPPNPVAAAPAVAAVRSRDGYRLAWLGDPLAHFGEVGAVRYSLAGARLHLADEAWLDGAPVPELAGQLAAAGDFAVELVIAPANLIQEGPARILSLGLTPRTASLMIGQSGSRLEVRVRTTATNPDGTRPHLVSGDGVLGGGRQHVIFVRTGHAHRLFIDGRMVADVDVPGDLQAWDAQHPLSVGNDHRGGFPWAGSIDRIVLRAGAWTGEEVAARYRTWASSTEGGLEPAP